jgi:hypothetical protein
LLAAKGRLDLDADVRKYVPEFPVKTVGDAQVTITARDPPPPERHHALRGRAPDLAREYASPHPFEELVNGLDLFRESPLIGAAGAVLLLDPRLDAAPGSRWSAPGKERYADLAKELVLVPLGMGSTEPDYPSRAIPHRTSGYELAGEKVVEAFDDDVS